MAPTFNAHPQYANDKDGHSVPVVTAHFGNRYVGDVNFTINDSTGLITSLDSERMIRVSGAIADSGNVVGDPTLYANVVTPVMNHIAVLNAAVIGTTGTSLNGARGNVCSPAPCQYTEGGRNAETGLGNLVADSARFASRTDIATQNGGGIRTRTTLAHQAILRHLGERRENPNLDRRVGLRAGCHRQDAAQPGCLALHFVTDFVGHPFRENPSATGTYGQRLQNRIHRFR